MATYAAVNSLVNTIERLQKSSRIAFRAPSKEILKRAYEKVKSLQEVFEVWDRRNDVIISGESMNIVEGQIREAVSKLEDVMESHLLNQLQSHFERLDGKRHPLKFSIDLQGLRQDIDSSIEKVEELKRAYVKALHNLLYKEEEDEDATSSSGNDFGGDQLSKMVGSSDQFEFTKKVLQHPLQADSPIFSLVGMPGIGKTTLAKKIFEDPSISEHFDPRAWVKVGQKCHLKEIPRLILAQVDPDLKDELMVEDDIIAQHLKESLNGKRFLIVLDDIWDTKEIYHYLKENVLPQNEVGGRFLLTSRICYWHQLRQETEIKMRLLNKKESWDLLREKVFVDESCPPQLEEPGKKIAENCEGLPLTIVTVASLLSKAARTPEYWKEAAEKQNSVLNDAYDKILEVLYPSYEYLPQRLKACFLFMGAFPQNSQIPRSNLINSLIADGFVAKKAPRTMTSENFAMECLNELVWNSLVMVYQYSTFNVVGAKICGLHSSLWHLSNREARKNKFFHILNCCADDSEEDMKSQRRLCMHSNILLGIKSVCNIMKDDCASSTARSLLCFGPYHQYQVPICFGLRLLRVLDALTIRFYEFPMEVLKLVQLRYLALTYNGNLPPSIAKLWNLQFLIIHRHMSIKSCGAPSFVPLEIWDMKELKLVQIMGSNLQNPNQRASLPNLSTLLGVSTVSCTEEVLSRIPKLKKLGIRIELVHNVAEPLGCLNHISHFCKLESLKCVIVNPEFSSGVVPPPAPHSMFPPGLRKLTLSGFGYPWKYMRVIASLLCLQVLKLQHYAFRGPKWEIEDYIFKSLRILLIEDTDLVQWKIGCESFPWLYQLSIKHCYKLEEIYKESKFPFLSKIEVVDCNPLTMTRAAQLRGGSCNKLNMTARAAPWRQDRLSFGVDVHSSWEP